MCISHSVGPYTYIYGPKEETLNANHALHHGYGAYIYIYNKYIYIYIYIYIVRRVQLLRPLD